MGVGPNSESGRAWLPSAIIQPAWHLPSVQNPPKRIAAVVIVNVRMGPAGRISRRRDYRLRPAWACFLRAFWAKTRAPLIRIWANCVLTP
jgi:hypothetical protein